MNWRTFRDILNPQAERAKGAATGPFLMANEKQMSTKVLPTPLDMHLFSQHLLPQLAQQSCQLKRGWPRCCPFWMSAILFS